MIPESGDMIVLVSGLDSNVLAVEAASMNRFRGIQPAHIRFGFTWEEAEAKAMWLFLEKCRYPSLLPLQTLEVRPQKIYAGHWATTQNDVPDADSPDLAVEIPGRNLLLLSYAMVYAAQKGFDTIAVAVLRGNPFSDATQHFFEQMSDISLSAVGRRIRIRAPYKNLNKSDVIRRGTRLPLHLTFSCIAPRDNLHCGLCNKCGERRRAFAAADIEDRTDYASCRSILTE